MHTQYINHKRSQHVNSTVIILIPITIITYAPEIFDKMHESQFSSH